MKFALAGATALLLTIAVAVSVHVSTDRGDAARAQAEQKLFDTGVTHAVDAGGGLPPKAGQQ
jgi:hypothetical protein